MKYSDDNGETFSDPIILVNGFDGDFEDKLYTGGADYDKEHNGIWFAWVFFDCSEMLNRNVYLGYLDLTTHHFFTYANEDLGSMVNRAAMDEKCMIYNSESNNTQFGSLRLTPEGEPIVFGTLGASLCGEGSYVSFHMVNGVMVMKDMGVKTGNMETTWGDMIVYGRDNVEAYVPTGGNITGADAIERLRYDGEWHKEAIVFQEQMNPLTTLQCVRGDKPTTQTVAKMIFGEGYDSDTLPDTKDVPVNVYFYYEEQAIPEFSSEAVLLGLVACVALILFLTKKKGE